MNFGLFGRGSDGWLLVFGLGRQSGGAMGMSNPLAGMSGMGATMPTGMPPAMQAMGVPGRCFCTCVWLFVLFVLCWTSKAYSSLLSSCFFSLSLRPHHTHTLSHSHTLTHTHTHTLSLSLLLYFFLWLLSTLAHTTSAHTSME